MKSKCHIYKGNGKISEVQYDLMNHSNNSSLNFAFFLFNHAGQTPPVHTGIIGNDNDGSGNGPRQDGGPYTGIMRYLGLAN